MQSACISLRLQRDNKSKELCISLTHRAACMNMTFYTLLSTQPSFPVVVPTSPAPALTPASSARSSWALPDQAKAGGDQQKCLRGSRGSQLPLNYCLWLPNEQAREDRASLSSEVFSDGSRGNGHKLQHEKFWEISWGKILSPWKWSKTGPGLPSLWILHPWRYSSLN